MRVGVQNRKRWLWVGIGIVVLVMLLVFRSLAKRQEAECDEMMAGLQTALERGDRAQIQQHMDRTAAVCKTVREGERARIAESLAAPQASAAAAVAPPSVRLPEARVDASTILGRKRAEVRQVLGKQTQENADRDMFARGAMTMQVRYERDVAVNFAVATTAGLLDETATRAWLGLPPSGAATIRKRTYNISLQKDVNALVVTDDEWVRREDERDAAAAAKQKQEQQAQSRQDFAKRLDTTFLDQGWDATVLVRGTTLRIEFALCNRAFLHQLVNKDETAIPTLQAVGFQRVECSNGYNKSARIDL